jgi:hypothetical protein
MDDAIFQRAMVLGPSVDDPHSGHGWLPVPARQCPEWTLLSRPTWDDRGTVTEWTVVAHDAELDAGQRHRADPRVDYGG